MEWWKEWEEEQKKKWAHIHFEDSVQLMDDDLREQVHAELAPCTEEEFLERYKELHLQKYGEEFVNS